MRAKDDPTSEDLSKTNLSWLLAVVLSVSIGLPLAFGIFLRLFG
jgi:hypothetical protein